MKVHLFVYFFLLMSLFCSAEGSLSVKENNTGRSIIMHENNPVLAFGPSPQKILTYLPKGNGNDFYDWLLWAKKYGITHVRSYPPSIIVDTPARNLFKRAEGDSLKFDLTKFNDDYFAGLREACVACGEAGIIIHLQLWQAVYWKNNWDELYYNPTNNINHDIARYAGPGSFVTMENPKLLEHQKEYVRKILDATADIGNVFYDIMNEIGNGTGSSALWVQEIIACIRVWEIENGIKVLITLNDEGGKRLDDYSLVADKFDLIIKDLGRYDEHVGVQREHNKPSLSVRNIDWNYAKQKRGYFFRERNLEITADENLQIRGRKYWWRMFMAGVQSAGAYSDAVELRYWHKVGKLAYRAAKKAGFGASLFDTKIATYKLNTITEKYFSYFKTFIDRIENCEKLQTIEKVVFNHPVATSYSLQSSRQAIIYIESPNGHAGYRYDVHDAVLARLLLPDGEYKMEYYFPYEGTSVYSSCFIKNGECIITIPEFADDLVIKINS
ncbi:hypothetical protein ACFL3D_03255 [Candidatus Omnitrophota bacterium]